MDLIRLMRSSAVINARYDVRLVQSHLLDEGTEQLTSEVFENVEIVWGSSDRLSRSSGSKCTHFAPLTPEPSPSRP